jgi:hypothetical protein
MVADQPLYPLNLSTPEALTPLDPDWFQPELRTGFLALDVHMGRLVPVRRVKEKTIWSCSKNGWQLSQFTWRHGSTEGGGPELSSVPGSTICFFCARGTLLRGLNGIAYGGARPFLWTRSLE